MKEIQHVDSISCMKKSDGHECNIYVNPNDSIHVKHVLFQQFKEGDKPSNLVCRHDENLLVCNDIHAAWADDDGNVLSFDELVQTFKTI